MVRTRMLPFRHKFNSNFIGRVDLHDAFVACAGRRDFFWVGPDELKDLSLYGARMIHGFCIAFLCQI